MGLAIYFLRNALTKFFNMQTEAEKTRDSMIQTLDNLPDAVLMLEDNKLSYCNQHADSFFAVKISQLERAVLRRSDYLIMNNRCLHELDV